MNAEAARIRQLEEANRALLEGHAKISTAYLALRLARVEDENRRLSQEVLQLKTRCDALRAELAGLRREIKVDREAVNMRLDQAAVVVKSLRDNQQNERE